MICPNCKHELPDDARFCGECGAEILKEKETENVTEEAVNVEVATESVSEKQSEEETVASEEVVFCPAEETKPKKKKGKKGILVGIIALAAALVVGAGAVFFPYAANAARKLFMSPEKYYHYIETSAAKDTAHLIASLLTGSSEVEKQLKVSTTLSVEELLLNLAPEGTGTPVDLDWISDLVFGAEITGVEDKKAATLKIYLDDGTLVTCEIINDQKNGKTYFKIPEISDKYFYTSTEPTEEETTNKISDIAEVLPKQEEVEEIIVRYLTLAIEMIDEVEESSELLEAGEVSQKYTTLSMKLNEKDIQEIAEKILKELKEDKQIEEIVRKVATQMDQNADEAYEEFTDGIYSALDEISELDDEDFEIEMKLWVNGKGEIVGREITTEDFEMHYATVQKGSKFAVDVYIEADGEKVVFGGSGKTTLNKVDGEFELLINKDEVLTVEISDFKVSGIKRDKFSGTISLKLNSEAEALSMNSDLKEKLGDIELEIKLEKGKDFYKADISLSSDEGALLSWSITTELTKNTKINIPTEAFNINDREEKEEYLKSMDIDKFISALKKTELDKEVIESIETELQSLVNEGKYLDAFDYYFGAVYKGEFARIPSLAPTEFWDEYYRSYKLTAQQVQETYANTFAGYMQIIKEVYGTDAVISYEVIDSYVVDANQFSYIRERINENYGVAGEDITGAFGIDFYFIIDGSANSFQEYYSYYLVEIDRTIYLCNEYGQFLTF